MLSFMLAVGLYSELCVLLGFTLVVVGAIF